MKNLSFLLFVSVFFSLNSKSQDFSEWRGPGRTGIYNETGLLKAWSESGPELIWSNDSLLDGYSSVATANEKVYLTGISQGKDVLIALDLKGNELWRTPYGDAWDASYEYSRATPTVEKDKVFVSSGKGDVACLDSENGRLIWKVPASKDYKCKIGKFGISESLLIDDKYVFFTPAGDETTMIALKKETGKLAWKSISLNDETSYCSPLMIEENGKRLIVNVLKKYIVGIQPEDGKILWKYDFGQYKMKRNNNTNTPIYANKELYISSGYDHKSVKLKLSSDLCSVELAWTDSILDVHHGGLVKIGNYLYGANWIHNRMGNWTCIDWQTGEKQYETEWFNKGSIISAEGMLYCFEEKTGNIALVKAAPKEFKVISSFKVPNGTGPYWAHPVINNGILFIRHGKSVMAFNIKK